MKNIRYYELTGTFKLPYATANFKATIAVNKDGYCVGITDDEGYGYADPLHYLQGYFYPDLGMKIVRIRAKYIMGDPVDITVTIREDGTFVGEITNLTYNKVVCDADIKVKELKLSEHEEMDFNDRIEQEGAKIKFKYSEAFLKKFLPANSPKNSRETERLLIEKQQTRRA